MTQHTPGPWSIGQDGALNYTIRGELPLGAGEIATVTSYATHPNGLTYANARLIAAAPELLEALEQLHAMHRAFGSNENWTMLDDEARELAEAIIKKARGQ